MYHHHSQPQGPPPPPNRPGPSHHQQQHHQDHFNYPSPSHLPDERVSAMATRGSGDMDHCLKDLVNRLNQISGSGGNSSNQLGHQQGMDWSDYPHPSRMFPSPPSTVTQQPQSSHDSLGNQAWMQAPVYDPPSPQTRGSHGGGNSDGGGVYKKELYTKERAESILATLGLSGKDLEFLSQYPEDQLNPDNLPFVLRSIQVNRQNSAASSSYSQSASRPIHDIPPPPARSLSSAGRLRSPEVPRFLSVPQTAGNVIDYGHTSQATDASSGRESMPERHIAHLQHFEPNVDLDYCRSSSEVHENRRLSPAREFPPLYRSGHPDQEYSRDGPRRSPSSETWNDSSSSSRHPALRSHGTTWRLPTPTMIRDFSAESPKVFPHTCSLCEVDLEHFEDWIEHVQSLRHTDCCRDLRNNYPELKHKLTRRERSRGRDDGQTTWHAEERSRSVSRSPSWSPTPSPLSRQRRNPSAFAFSTPTGHSRRELSPLQDDGQAAWYARERSPTRSVSLSRSWSPSPSPPPPDQHREDPHPQRRSYQTPRHSYHRHHQATESSSRDGLKRVSDATARRDDSARRKSAKSPIKTKPEPGSKRTKPGSSEADETTSAKGPPAKKLKKEFTTAPITAACLVYLTGIPTATTEEEVKTWVSGYGKYNNVVLFPGSEADQGQKASVCMVKEEDALALAQCSSLSIRDQPITATLAKNPEAGDSTAVSKGASSQKKSAIGGEDSGNVPELDEKKTFSPKSTVLISGLPESGWTESDVIKLCQPFATPTDIILARQLGKALLLMPEAEMAERLVKNHIITPMKINDFELKMINLEEQAISLNTPVALYNLLLNLPREARVSWKQLLVIRNVPDTPTASSEVQMLLERREMIHNTLFLNHNMIICDAVSPRQIMTHYHRFPCLIQSNPLYFTMGPDPTLQSQVWGPCCLPPWPTFKWNRPRPCQDNDAYVEENPNANVNTRRFYCHLCKCYINDPRSKNLHLTGRKHLSAIQEKNSTDDKREARKTDNVKEEKNRTEDKREATKNDIVKEKNRTDKLKATKNDNMKEKNRTDKLEATKNDNVKEEKNRTGDKREATKTDNMKEEENNRTDDKREARKTSNAKEEKNRTDKHEATKNDNVKEKKNTTEDKREATKTDNVREKKNRTDKLEATKNDNVKEEKNRTEDKREATKNDNAKEKNRIDDKREATKTDNMKEEENNRTDDKREARKTSNAKEEKNRTDKHEATKNDNVKEKKNTTEDKREATKNDNVKEKKTTTEDKREATKNDNVKEEKNRTVDKREDRKTGNMKEEKNSPKNRTEDKREARKTDNVKVSVSKRRAESKAVHTSPEKVDKVNSGPSCSAAGDGEFQDFPDLLDFVTVDEVGDATDFPSNPPTHAVAMDTTVTVDKDSPDDNKDGHKYDYLVDVYYNGTALRYFCKLCEQTLNGRDTRVVAMHVEGQQHIEALSRKEKPRLAKTRDKIFIIEDEYITKVQGGSPELPPTFYCSLCKEEMTRTNKPYHSTGRRHVATLWKKMNQGNKGEERSRKDKLDKMNSGAKETKKEVSSGKPAQRELPKVESKDDHFQDFPFDMTDFVTLDEVVDAPPHHAIATATVEEAGDTNPPPPHRAIATDATATVEETGDASPPQHAIATDATTTVEQTGDANPPPPHHAVATDAIATVEETGNAPPPQHAVATDAIATVEQTGNASPPPPAVISMESSGAVVGAKKTEDRRESEAEATPVPEDTPQASPGPVTLATAAPEKSESHSQRLDPVVTAERPHSPVPQAMCSSDQLDTPVPQPVAANMDSTLADESLPASAPATTAGSPKGATTPECDADSVTPTAGGEQENQGPDRRSQAEVEETEKVEQIEHEEDKEKTAASVSAKPPMPEEKEQEPLQKKPMTQDPPPPTPLDSNSAVGMEFLVPKTGFFCKLCNRFFTGGRESELKHCRGQQHHDNWQKYLKSRKTTSR